MCVEVAAADPTVAPLTPKWGEWSAFGACLIAPCGGCGRQFRERVCSSAGCVGQHTDYRACNYAVCAIGELRVWAKEHFATSRYADDDVCCAPFFEGNDGNCTGDKSKKKKKSDDNDDSDDED